MAVCRAKRGAGWGGEAVTGRGGILVLADLRQRAIKH